MVRSPSILYSEVWLAAAAWSTMSEVIGKHVPVSAGDEAIDQETGGS